MTALYKIKTEQMTRRNLFFICLHSLLSLSLPAAVMAEKDSLESFILEEYQPKTQRQVELLYILQEARRERKTNPEHAIILNKEFHKQCMEAGEFEYAATGFFEIGRILQDKEMYFSAIDYFLRGYQMFVDYDILWKSNYILIGIGNCYFHTGNYRHAEDHYRKAERMFLSSGSPYGIAVADNNIGLVKQKLNQHDSALVYFRKALEKRKGLNVPGLIGHSYYYIGTALAALGDTSGARSYFTKAMPLLFNKTADEYMNHDFMTTVADCYVELGKLNVLSGKYPDAIRDLNKAITICNSIRDRLKTPGIYLIAGRAMELNGERNKALENYHKALFIADSAKLYGDQKAGCESLMQMFLKQRQMDSVWYYFQKYRNVSEELQSEMKASRFNEIELDFKIRDAEEKATDQQEKNRNTIIFLLTTGFLLVLIILGTLLYIRKQRINAKFAEAEIKARKQAESDLEKANEELKERNADKDRFISILSHDLRSPFTSILGFADILVEETADINLPELRNYSKLLQQISRRTFDLLENLLAWSKLQMNNMPFAPTQLNIYSEVSVVLDTMMVTASRKQIQLKNLAEPESIVFADSNMVQTVLRNLVSNAIKFTDKGGEIEIRTGTLNGFVKVSVADNGIGIPEQHQNKLFTEKEGQITTPGTENEKGHGMGLTLCSYIVAKNKGRIWLESSSSEGSVFAFTLPVSPE